MTVKSHNIENTDQSVMIHIVPQTGQRFADHDGGPPPIKAGILRRSGGRGVLKHLEGKTFITILIGSKKLFKLFFNYFFHFYSIMKMSHV